MKHYFVFLLVLVLASCDNYKIKKKSTDEYLKEELKTFNWDNVDDYPTFDFCDSLESKKTKEACFINGLRSVIFDYLNSKKIEVTQDVNDTIFLKCQVTDSGKLVLLPFQVDSITLKEIPNIKTLIHESLNGLPKISPAIKRGQYVKTVMELPIIIAVE